MVAISGESKAEAVRRVSESLVFHRAEVLKALLDYLYAQETQGRAHEVTETEIAINVMRRGPAFSPESDSSVRTRFAALRKKLDEYFAGEGRDSDLRLEIPRGTYVLRFSRNEPPPALLPLLPDAVPAPPRAPAPLDAPSAGPRSTRLVFCAGLIAGCALAALAGWAVSSYRQRPTQAEILLAKAWGPMLDPQSDVTISLGTPASFFIRDFGPAEPPLEDPPYSPRIDRDEALDDWYKRTRNVALGPNFILHPNAHAPLWGDAASASIISRMLSAHGVRVEQAPSAKVHPVALRERNAVIIGRPEYTDAVRPLTPDDALIVEYSRVDRRVGIHNRRPRGAAERAWWFPTGGLRENYGLITVIGRNGAAANRTILFSGINSDGAEAGARYLTSPDKLADLDRRFRESGHSTWPASYQIVVRTHSMDTYSLTAEFDFLRVLE